MNIKAIAVAALVSVAMPAAVYAQAQTTTPAPASSSATPDVRAGAVTDFNGFMQGMSGADYTSATSGIDAATSFNVVKLSSLQDADSAQLQTALQPHEADIASLISKIGANEKAKAALSAEGLSADNVVWVDSDASGAVTLYVNDLDKAM